MRDSAFKMMSAATAITFFIALLVTPLGAQTITPVMTGLNAPRGLAWGPEGGLYVAEAGNATLGGPCAPVARGQNCYSASGSISRYWKGAQERVVIGLPSAVNPTTGDIAGPQHLSLLGRGSAYVTIGWGAAPSARSGLGDLGSLFGTLVQFEPSGQWRIVTDISAFEDANNPAGGPKDSNPYGLLTEAGGRYVTDAGGNDLLHVAANGTVSLVTTFAPVPAAPPFNQAEPVPTEVRRGPDGELYVSELTGFPFTAGVAGIYRVVPGQAPQLVAAGFKTITDFAFGPDGSLYVLQYASSPTQLNGPGSVVKVAPNGTQTTIIATLHQPTGIAIGDDGAIYVSNNGNSAAVGEVLRIVP
jgi:sugar lactone lactonase YvrE